LLSTRIKSSRIVAGTVSHLYYWLTTRVSICVSATIYLFIYNRKATPMGNAQNRHDCIRIQSWANAIMMVIKTIVDWGSIISM